MLVAIVLLGFGIGTSLGLLGGGGSILTVPALVYVVGQTPQVAITTSLAIVGANSAMGTMFHRTDGTLHWRIAFLFGGSGMVVSYLSADISKQLSPSLLMAAFAILMLVVGTALFRKTDAAPTVSPGDIHLWKVLAVGSSVGLVTGILGVGGGFLIAPTLVMFVGLPIHHAVGTSLVVITMNSIAGFLGHLDGLALDIPLLTAFIIGGIPGTAFGAFWSKRLDAAMLRKMFALFVIGLAVFLLYDNLLR